MRVVWAHGARVAVRRAVVAACLSFFLLGHGSVPQSASPSVLVLYDTSGAFGVVGAEHALMLRNLLGHFDVRITTKSVGTYRGGEMATFDATFYLGSTYDARAAYMAGSAEQAAYDAFLTDTAISTRPVVWANYNLWSLAWNWRTAWGPSFADRYGIEFVGNDTSRTYDRVSYKGTDLLKGVVLHANPGTTLVGCTADPAAPTVHACSPELNTVRVLDTAKARVVAEAFSTRTGARAPYITVARNLWVVGDMPFMHLSEEDRYLAFADVLHDVLDIQHAERHHGLVRLEDVSAATPLAALTAVTGALQAQGVPYSVALIPLFEDPDGAGSQGVARRLPISGTAVAEHLRAEVAAGRAHIVQHGTTHQWGGAPNPYSRMSAADFEFYRVAAAPDGSLSFVGPIPDDSPRWAAQRTSAGHVELWRAGLPAFAWEAPHYTASAVDYAAIRPFYSRHYGRMVYFATPSTTRFFGQFFPYEILRDSYGLHIVPENLANVAPAPLPGFRSLLPADLVRHARKGLVVRDGYASFFYHPPLGPAQLLETIEGIKALGYRFVGPIGE